MAILKEEHGLNTTQLTLSFVADLVAFSAIIPMEHFSGDPLHPCEVA